MLPLTLLKHCCTRCKNSKKFGFNSLAGVFGKRTPHGTTFVSAACDYYFVIASEGVTKKEPCGSFLTVCPVGQLPLT